MNRTILEVLALGLTVFFTVATSMETPCQSDAQCYSGDVCHPDGFCVSRSQAEPCGEASCYAGEFCCNPSCGLCAPTGASCTQQVCAASEIQESRALSPALPVVSLPGGQSSVEVVPLSR